MVRMTLLVAMLITSVGACGDDEALPIDARDIDARDIDARVDAPIDAMPGPCGAEVMLTGEYIDWTSTQANFDGVETARWQVVDPPGGRTAMTAPNGRVILCIAAGATSQIDVTQAAYLPARFVADPAVFAPTNTTFSIRGLKTGMAADPWTTFSIPLDPAAAQVFVFKIGAPIGLALAPAVAGQRSFVTDGDNDITWTESATGTLTLFANRPVGAGTATLTSQTNFTGPTTLPLAAGRFTITVIR